MIASPTSANFSEFRTLVEQGEQLLTQVPPGRAVRRLAAAFRQLADADSQGLKLAIVGPNQSDCHRLSQQLAKACPSVEISCTTFPEMAHDPHALQRQVQWSDAALLVPADPASKSSDQNLTKLLVHCFQSPIALSLHADEPGNGVTVWADEDESLGHRLAGSVTLLKQLANARRLVCTARNFQHWLGQSAQHYKCVLSQMERPTRSTASRLSNLDCDKTWLPMRDAFAERMVTIERELVIASERATQPLGELSGLLRSIVHSVTVEKLECARTSSQVKLSLNAGHLATLNRRFEHTLRERFMRELKQAENLVRAAMDASCRPTSPDLQFSTAKLPTIDIQRAWRSVENLMAIGKEAAIEIPRKGIFDLLTAGRQKVFIIIMFISLMGRMGLPKLFTTPLAHLGFGLFMAAVMIASMVLAIGRWRKENAQTIEKELQKFRDTMLTEGSKVIDQVERVKLNSAREYLKDVQRSFESLGKTQIESMLRQQQARADELQQRQEAVCKVLEGRLKQVTECERTLERYAESVQIYLAARQREWRSPADAEATPLQADSHAAMPSRAVKPAPTRAVSALAERRAKRTLCQP